jgi:hypothetical protein
MMSMVTSLPRHEKGYIGEMSDFTIGQYLD